MTDPLVSDDRSPVRTRRSRVVSMVVLVVLLAAGTFVEIGHLANYRTFSPIDELQHVDYVIRVTQFDMPGSGSRVGQEAARAETCLKIDMDDTTWIPSCAVAPDEVDIEALQEGGYNTAYVHPPLYYLTNGVVYRVATAVAGDHLDTLTAARLGNLLWVWASIILLWLLFAELGATLWVRSALVLLVIAAPTFVHATGAANPDATAIAVGAGLLWAAVRWERTRRWLLLLPALSLVAVFTKVTNLFAVGIACLVILWPTVPVLHRRLLARVGPGRTEPDAATEDDSGDDIRPRLIAVGVMVATVAVGALAFRVLQSVVQEMPPNELPMAIPSIVHRFPISGFFPAWHIGVSPLQSPHVAPFLAGTWLNTSISFVDLAVMVGAVAGTVLAAARSIGRRIGGAALVMAVAAGPAIVAFNFFVSSVYAPVPPRYALSIVPALLAASLPVLRNRWVGRASVVVAVLLFLPVALAVVWPAPA